MVHHSIARGSFVSGPTLPEPIEVLAVVPMGQSLKIIGRGRRSGQTYDPVLNPQQLAMLTVSAEREPFDGDARRFRLGLAYEYDPFFSLVNETKTGLKELGLDDNVSLGERRDSASVVGAVAPVD